MKKGIHIIFILFTLIFNGFGQTWQSLNFDNLSNTVPYNQFIIDRYRNDIWLINENQAAVIENSGFFRPFDSDDLGSLFNGDKLQFCFTSDSLFYMKYPFGLFNFNNYITSQIYNETEIKSIFSNNDTIYLLRAGSALKYIDGEVIDTYFYSSDFIAKNIFLYTYSGYLGKKNGISILTLESDPQYLMAPINSLKFQNSTDSVYVGTTKGIMYAYNYDILDTITPNNTFNMPSPNVLEMEFDADDSLWAVFGDTNDDPFAIAKLEGDTWTNLIDASNSPIDFTTFLGLEIDTLGNLWVADQNYLHTLLTPNSPGWLSTMEIESDLCIQLYPNPANHSVQIKTDAFQTVKIEISDLCGKLVYSEENVSDNVNIDIHKWKPGIYLVKIMDNKNQLTVKKLEVLH